MSAKNDLQDAVNELRKAAASLIRQAEQIEATAAEIESHSSSNLAAPEPLTHTDSDEEAAARLIALEGAASGREREDLLSQLKRDFPSVDSESLVQRFYS